MRKWTLFIGMLVLASFVLAACGGAQGNAQPANNIMSDESNNNQRVNMSDDDMSDDMENEMDDNSHEEMSNDMDDNMDDSGDDLMGENNDNNMGDDMMDEEDAASDTPAWFDNEFVDAATGETFTINDFRGKVVMVETMALWCTNCLKQQKIVKEFHTELGERDDFIAIGLGIDPEEDLAMVAAYIDHHEFDWLYSISPVEVSAEISRDFGPQYLNPPSTPIAIIDKDGGIHTLPFGIKSVEELISYVELYLN